MISYMETTIGSGVPAAPATRSASIQWMGVQWQGGDYALPLSSIGAVFRAAHSEQLAEKKILDIEVHAGAAVFVRPFTSCFDLSATMQDPKLNEERRWVVVLITQGQSLIGCRVNQVVGPFWAEAHAEKVVHAGRDWSLLRPLGKNHA